MYASPAMAINIYERTYEEPLPFLLDPALIQRPNKRQRTSSISSFEWDMSDYHFKPSSWSTPQESFAFSPALAPQEGSASQCYTDFTSPLIDPLLEPHFSTEHIDPCQLPLPHDAYYVPPPQQQTWIPPLLPTTTHQYQQLLNDEYLECPTLFDIQCLPATGFSPIPLSYDHSGHERIARAGSLVSETSSSQSYAVSGSSRGASPSATEMSKWGKKNLSGTWSCAFPGCTSRSTFSRGCDLRKHYKRHSKTLFCRHDGCPQSTEGGFSSKKDRSRHEAKHNPGVTCEWDGCERLFSRQDNMKDHVRRVHMRSVS
ncbi:unnamed protein product [Zymoseptoria tritici ST99CH_1A5]|uniref:C2H2-type domain-containing protein n=2 Tax=Zymoseptoria tritici TaxID=1047171 RepID=A0A2H1H3M0_ZYMTR|nr:unnamed protein product [Zymoseptoria tritici ST99CH_1E4]SMR63490.1 unnamed protein product [Zymoseptoria tritici ST99CH_3D1]SMY28835.1 unnamed protein product [Zymoseptoria tritici ST99CH_1A5]